MNKILIVGLGSMGKRRIRNLQKLGYRQLIGFDLRDDRIIETKKKYIIERRYFFFGTLKLNFKLAKAEKIIPNKRAKKSAK